MWNEQDQERWRQHEEYRLSKKLPPHQLRGLMASLEKGVDENTDFEDIRDANPDAMAQPLRDAIFCVNNKRVRLIDPIQISSVGKQIYYDKIDKIDYSNSFKINLEKQFAAFVQTIPYQVGWEKKNKQEKKPFYKKINQILWDNFLDPRRELARASNKEFRKPRYTHPTIELIYPNEIGLLEKSVSYVYYDLQNAEPHEAKRLLIKSFDINRKNVVSPGEYNGLDWDKISLYLGYSSQFQIPSVNLSKLDLHEQHEYEHLLRAKTNIKTVLEEKIGLRAKNATVVLDDSHMITREGESFSLIYDPRMGFIHEMACFTHEQTHRYQELSAVYFERAGEAPFGFSLQDYELTKLSLINYVKPEEDYALYQKNVLERHADSIGELTEAILYKNRHKKIAPLI